MLAARLGPRTSMNTLAACCDRNTAAWPGRVAAADQHDLVAARTSWLRSAEAQYHTPRPSNSARRGTAGRR